MLELEDGDKVKVFQYVALMSKGRIESDKDQVFKYLVENLKSSCDVITDLIQIDLCKSNFYIKNCTKFKSCKDCLNYFLDWEVDYEEVQRMQ
jgi:hypothetical protein|nr:MAG TPA: hypothetical protein [Caudoviricetes sp.]